MKVVYDFMKKDSHHLKKGYNPLEIHFSMENIAYFQEYTPEDLLKISNAANYLEYYYLLELTCKIFANELLENGKSELSKMIKGPKKVTKEQAAKINEEYEWFEDIM